MRRQTFLSWRTSLLCIVVELAGGGSVAIGVSVAVDVAVAVAVTKAVAVALAVADIEILSGLLYAGF